MNKETMINEAIKSSFEYKRYVIAKENASKKYDIKELIKKNSCCKKEDSISDTLIDEYFLAREELNSLLRKIRDILSLN